MKINDNNDFSNYFNSGELWRWEDMFIFRMYNNIDFNLIIFFYNSLRSVIYIANSIEIFFGSVVLYGV